MFFARVSHMGPALPMSTISQPTRWGSICPDVPSPLWIFLDDSVLMLITDSVQVSYEGIGISAQEMNI
jgi:hypothetical protein